MATIESKNLLVWVKAMSRGQNLPLDASEIYDSYESAVAYTQSPIAYAGQTIKALVNDKYVSYVLQPSESGYTLEEVGAVKASDLKQYVIVDSKLPESGQEQGIIYINTTDKTGSIWNGSGYIQVFKDVQVDLDTLNEQVENVEKTLTEKAPLENPNFSGSVKVDGDPVALKSYVDGLIGNLTSCAPGIVDSTHPLPVSDYKAGQTFRVAEDGTYAGSKCEIGDLIIVVKDYEAESASDDDFMIIQANIDGAVTTAVESATVGEIVVFDSVTGKVVKGAGINISSLQEVIEKSHEHENKEVLDTYDKTQEQLLVSAKSDAQTLVDALKVVVDEKANKGTSLAEYGIEDAYTKPETDALLDTIKTNLNTKVDASTVDTKISDAKTEILNEAKTNATETLNQKIGDISEGTSVKEYIDNAIGSGGTSNAEAIAKAKEEAISAAKAYTDEQIEKSLTVVEF